MSCPKWEIPLTERELRLLELFRTAPFMPVVRRLSTDTPFLLLEDGDYSDELMWLMLKGLVDIDLSRPVAGCGYEDYPPRSARGSASLTAKGQDALDSLDLMGVLP